MSIRIQKAFTQKLTHITKRKCREPLQVHIKCMYLKSIRKKEKNPTQNSANLNTHTRTHTHSYIGTAENHNETSQNTFNTLDVVFGLTHEKEKKP